jgi:hypothetical protein
MPVITTRLVIYGNPLYTLYTQPRRLAMLALHRGIYYPMKRLSASLRALVRGAVIHWLTMNSPE